MKDIKGRLVALLVVAIISGAVYLLGTVFKGAIIEAATPSQAPTCTVALPTMTPKPTATPVQKSIAFQAIYNTISVRGAAFTVVSLFGKASQQSCVTDNNGLCHIVFADLDYTWFYEAGSHCWKCRVDSVDVDSRPAGDVITVRFVN